MDKLILSEKQILTTIRLSGVQKAILAKITAAATPEVAYEQISDGRNFVAARDILRKLGLVDFTEGTASVTETGKKVMKDENLMDDSEQLTSDGKQYVEAQSPTDIKKPTAGTDDSGDAGQPPQDDLGLGGDGEPVDDLGLGDKADKEKNPFEGILNTINNDVRALSESAIDKTTTE